MAVPVRSVRSILVQTDHLDRTDLGPELKFRIFLISEKPGFYHKMSKIHHRFKPELEIFLIFFYL